MNVTIVDQPELRIAGIRHLGSYQEIGRTFGRLGGILKGPPPADSQMIALYHDDPAVTPADQLRSDAALTMSVHTPIPDGLVEQSVPAGRYARTIHKGGYDGLPAIWNALKTEWLPASGYRMGHPGYEIYTNTPMTVPAAELVTEIYMRLDG